MRRRPARPSGRSRRLGARARPSIRGSSRRRAARARRARPPRRTARRTRRQCSRAPRGRSPRAWQHGTSQASASSTASPKPSRSDGTRTALAALTYSGTCLRRPVAEREQRNAAGDRERSVVALLGPARVGREQQVAAVRLEIQGGRAACVARDRAEAVEVDAGGEHRGARPAPPISGSPRRGARTRRRRGRGRAARRSVIARERGCARSVPWSVTARTSPWAANAGHALRPKWAWTTSNRVAAAPAELAGGLGSRRTCRPVRTRTRRRRPQSMRRSASTWSRTKLPSAGRAALGYMLVTISARMRPRETTAALAPCIPA